MRRNAKKETTWPMSDPQANNPMHGMTLEKIVTFLAERYGWEQLGTRIRIRCFQSDPSVKSSLKFLRKTPWARKKVEDLFLNIRETELKRAARKKQG